MVRVAINGYGRIGRIAHRVILEKHSQDIEVVAINAGSSTDIKGWMYLFKYDTVYGPLKDHEVTTYGSSTAGLKDMIGYLVVDQKQIPVFSQKDAQSLPWEALNVDVVIESTGHFTTSEKLLSHLSAGAKSAVLSSPAKSEDIPTYVLSVNQNDYHGEKAISNASCTTNCVTPVAKIIDAYFGIEKAMMTTIHAYTSDQRLQDGGHKDYRRGRAAASNIVPTSTGATIAAAHALPSLKDKFNGLAIRVPVTVGSLSDFTFVLKKQATVEDINEAFKEEVKKPEYKNIIEVSEDPLVSSDIIGNSHSAIVDLSLTSVVGGTLAKVVAWYDNEWGYANRLIEEVLLVGKNLNNTQTPSSI